jgi:hypothetical protein
MRIKVQKEGRHQDVFSRGGTGVKRPSPSLPSYNLPPHVDEPAPEPPSVPAPRQPHTAVRGRRSVP